MQLLSKAYLRVQEWKQMEMETVVGWLGLKEGSEKRGGIKGSKLQVEISIGLCPQVHESHGAKTETQTNTCTPDCSPLVCTVQLSMKRVSSQVEKKEKCPNASSWGPLHTKRESTAMAMALLQRWHFTISLRKHLSFPPSHPSLEPAWIKTKMKWKKQMAWAQRAGGTRTREMYFSRRRRVNYIRPGMWFAFALILG